MSFCYFHHFVTMIITFYQQVGGDEDSEEEVGMGGPSKLDSEGEDDDKSEED